LEKSKIKIVKEITKKLSKREKINDRLIYIADIYLEIETIKIRSKNKKKYIEKDENGEIPKRTEILKNQVYESKPDSFNLNYFIKEVERKCKLIVDKKAKTKETMQITKIVLLKEIGCSTYE